MRSVATPPAVKQPTEMNITILASQMRTQTFTQQISGGKLASAESAGLPSHPDTQKKPGQCFLITVLTRRQPMLTKTPRRSSPGIGLQREEPSY